MNATTERSAIHARTYVLFVGALGALAGLMFGLDIGVISGAQHFIQDDFKISDRILEDIVSWMMIGAALGAALASFMSSRLGRKRSLVLGAGIFVLASVMCGLAGSVDGLLAWRLVLGLAIGVLTFTAPMYLAEVSPERNRGAIVASYQLMITIGILLAFLSDTAFSYSGNWHWMLGIIAIPGFFFLVGVLALPESPRWLMMKGRKSAAVEVLHRLRADPGAVAAEISEIEAQLKIPQRGLTMFVNNRNFRRSVGLGVLLQFVQQLTGMNVVMYYAPHIFQDMGYALTAQMWFTAAVGLTNVLATFIAIAFVDRLGRKPILYIGFCVMAIGLGLVGLMMHLGITSHAEQLFTVVMLLIFIVGFAMSAGPLIWILCSEVQPLQGRNFGIGVSTVANWVGNFVVGATFLSLLTHFGHANTFWLYAGLNVLFILITLGLIPETKGVTLEHIERDLMAGKPLRTLGQ